MGSMDLATLRGKSDLRPATTSSMAATRKKRLADEAGLDARPSALRVSKARARAECKRHKIRCEMKPGDASCAKCIRSGIRCVVNDFSQRFVEDDERYVDVDP
ncbi:hypothetical protein VTN02DRAFT_716 [Thermoascus thermophilus]